MSATAGVWSRDWSEARDETLLQRVRAGESEAYAELWRRHLPSAYAVATQYRGRASVEDIVGEASLRIYDRIRAGQGPTSNFRSYFLTAVKSVAIDLGRVELRVVPTEPEDLEAASTAVPPYNAALRVDQDLVRVAFGRLSELDQQVLWRTTVEGVSPAIVGSTMGMSANRVSVAALRARDALRARYLDAHADRAVERAKTEECRWVLSQMGRYVRGKLRSRQRARVDQHLTECRHARVLALELTEINRGIPALLVPLIFVGGTSSVAIWASAGLVAGYGGACGPQAPLADPSLATAAASAQTATIVVAKAAAVVAAGALGAGLMPATSPGLDAASGGGQLQAAGIAPRSEIRSFAGSLGLSGAGSLEFADAPESAVKPSSETTAGAANVRSESLLVSISQPAAVAAVLSNLSGAVAAVANLPAAVAAVLTSMPSAVAAAPTPAGKTSSGAAAGTAASSTVPSVPESTTPAVTTPAVTTPESTTAVVTTPAATTPATTTPESTTPAVTTPAATTPESITPVVTTPAATTPESTTAESTTPAVTTTESTTPPESTTPAATPPESTTAESTTPASTVPSVPGATTPAPAAPSVPEPTTPAPTAAPSASESTTTESTTAAAVPQPGMTTAITSVGVSEAVPVGSATSSSTPVKKAPSTTQAPTVQQPKTTRTSVRKRTTAVKTSTGSSGNVAATTALPAAMVNRRTAKLHNLNSTRLQALVESLNQSSDMRLQLQTLRKNVNSKHPMCQLQAI